VEDATITEEIQVVVSEAEDAKVVLEEKEAEVPLEEKVVVTADSEAIATVRLQEEKADLEEKEAVLLLEEKVDFLTEHRDVQKALEILLDQEDQEEVNTNSLIFL
jgi:hypothetical protein